MTLIKITTIYKINRSRPVKTRHDALKGSQAALNIQLPRGQVGQGREGTGYGLSPNRIRGGHFDVCWPRDSVINQNNSVPSCHGDGFSCVSKIEGNGWIHHTAFFCIPTYLCYRQHRYIYSIAGGNNISVLHIQNMTYLHTYKYANALIYAHKYVHTFTIHTLIYVYTHTHKYTHTHMRIHTYTYTCMRGQKLFMLPTFVLAKTRTFINIWTHK